ncbi:hypothetical protein PsorP6_015066 [Peronosclerospora sorghi]|uniref:Uncharacterized protein n=1 Tax=Peronosclerospora sorghi TaxID=230839 RepID=A0ACC0VRM5_9STRA|nr:hypothetical protein PsorP6_015066 [Peronosclerospora sorghi]
MSRLCGAPTFGRFEIVEQFERNMFNMKEATQHISEDGTLQIYIPFYFIGVAWDSLRNLCAVTEYMDRGDLSDVLYALKCHGSPLDTTLTWHDQKITIALHIFQGLAYMHSRSPKVIHRDLKSMNVLLNDAYARVALVSRARLTTLGEQKSSPTNAPANAATFMTPGVGTSFWIAPEVLLGKEYDEQSDVFSFGVVLSELDTDEYPYWNSGHVPGG